MIVWRVTDLDNPQGIQTIYNGNKGGVEKAAKELGAVKGFVPERIKIETRDELAAALNAATNST